jgi:hypothetical protein
MRKPWGKFWKLISAKNFWVKLIWVKGRTSLHSHKKRGEIHFGISFIPKGKEHRLNKGVYLEFAFGKPEEDDNTRYEDDYGRIKSSGAEKI